MIQTKRNSMVEAVTNTAIGYGINLFAQTIIFPFFGIHVTFSQNIGIGLAFTGISIARGYAVRRWFTAKTESA